MSTTNLGPLGHGHERPVVPVAHPAPPPQRQELQDRASADAVLNATGPDGAEIAFAVRVEQWLDQWIAEQEVRLGVARRNALDHIRDAGTALTRAAAHLDLVTGRVTTARTERDRLADITAGVAPGDDGGLWPARARTGQTPGREAVKDGLLYGGAALAEVELNYLALQILDRSPLETALLVAAIVLVNVLLPKQLGEMAARHRRAVTGRGRLVAGLVTGAALWLGVSVFVALVRTAFLLLPAGTSLELGAPVLLVDAGLSAELLTWGWLVVVLAVGLVVFFRAAARYNPYVGALRAATERTDTQERERVNATAAAQSAQLDAHRAWEALPALQTESEREQDRLVALAGEVVAHHRAELARHRTNPGVVAMRRSIAPTTEEQL